MEPNHIYQFSILNALMSGVCEIGITANELKDKACNHGLGTFSRMDGELVLLGDGIYRLRTGGQVCKADDETQIPFAMIANLKPQHTRDSLTIHQKSDIDTVLNQLCGATKNLFVAWRLEGTFARVKTRTVGGQAYRGQPLTEVGKTQSVEEYSNVQGIVVGFRSPDNWQGFSVAGEHLHFISADRSKGGHVLELSTNGHATARLEASVISHVHVELPQSSDFKAARLVTDSDGVKAVEG